MLMNKTLTACTILLGCYAPSGFAADAQTQAKTLITIADAKTSPAVGLDLGKPGDSIGDQWLFDQPLLDAQRKNIGNNSGVCIRTKVGNSSQCQWTLTLNGGGHDAGTIQVAGREFDQGSSAIAIVGGTGAYQHISGELISFKNADGTYTQTLSYTLAPIPQTDSQSLISKVRKNGHYSCIECHGKTGNPPITDKYQKQSPILAGQNYQYLLTQLNHFKSGSRFTEEMGQSIQDYSAAEINQIAFYFSQQNQTTDLPFDASIDTLKHSVADDKLWADIGRVLYQQGDKSRGIVACQSCHGEAGAGDSLRSIPKLAAQHARYVRMTLQNYKTGKRTTDNALTDTLKNSMQTAVKNLSDDDIKHLAAYIQSMVIAP
ncbi:MAG: dirigent protein [Algicola sp.]|nr:dirigent protein [Algicola sp.]